MYKGSIGVFMAKNQQIQKGKVYISKKSNIANHQI